MQNGYCPKCREKLEIPDHLQTFSCLYCGARLTSSDLTKTPTSIDGAASLAYYQEHILDVFSDSSQWQKKMTSESYPSVFDAFTSLYSPAIEHLELAVASGKTTTAAQASFLLDAFHSKWEKAAVRDLDKFVMAIYLIPMVRKMALPCSEDYCKSLYEIWMERYPKSPFQIGDYDILVNGFRKRFAGLCFITTAICAAEGKPDDCAELTAFRHFRDTYLHACSDGPALIEEYYRIAPTIVARIELSENRDDIYANLRENYLNPCYRYLQCGNHEACKSRYQAMVRTLQTQFLGEEC